MNSKQKTFNVRNFIKTETVRLESLALPRDLSLGGTKPKKVYKPNLNVVRNKNKPKEIINRAQQQKKNHRTVQTNKGTHSQRYVQSSGVFSQGTAEIKRPKIHSDRYLNYKDQDTSSMSIPKVAHNTWNVDVKQEAVVIDELLADDEDSSSENDGEYGPVILPLSSNKDNFLNTFKVKKEEVKVKDEIEDSDEPKSKVANGIRANSAVNFDPDYQYQVPLSFKDDKMYDDDHPCISLIRMPDSLPGKGFAEDSDKPVDYTLDQMNEGKIGKMLIRKSGKVEVYIGNTKYILDVIDSTPFKEELMYIPENLKSSFSPDMANLGSVDEKYVLSPRWKNLFYQKNKKK